MESNPPPATQWEDLDSDEIGSVASEDLYENRPNRWTGTKSTWRDLTGEERMLWRSMQQVVDRDLAVHLYDAFALKRQGLDPSTAQGLTVKLDDRQDAVWAPPKAWTAWPLQEKQVPREGLFKEETDENEAFTLRKKEEKLPSTELQDELGATVLRLAKQRFRRRQRHRQHQTRHVPVQPSIETPSSPVPPRDENSENESLLPSSPPGMDEPSDKTSDDGGSPSPSDAERRTTRDYEPTVSTDDHLSYHLLRPSIRHMLAQLDRTLTILHNARVAGLSHLSDSASSTEDDSDAGAGTPRKRGKPRRKPQPAGPIPPSPPSRRGRPRKVHAPLGGETPEEMQLRVARQAHRRLPWTEKDQEAVFEAWLRRGDLRRLRRLEQQQPHGRPGSPPQQQQQQQQQPASAANTEKKLRRWGLRDWSDVIGAASLAGFPPGVIARSAQRCANLFGQGMMLRRLDERPSSRPGFATTEYRPDRIRLSASPSSDDSDSDSPPPEAILTQKRIASRQASLARSRSRSGISSPTSSSPVSSCRRGRSPGRSASASASHSRSHSRSRSRCSSAGLLFCPVQTCHRAANGFARRANLRRHVHLVHPGCAEGEQDEQDESDDEVVGAVHVDGFLKTIHPGRGWRGEDVVARKRWRVCRQAGMDRDRDRDRDRDGDGDGE
ncbi:hypothetical protein C2857_003339 [Epichloe festucae Fl1]|uniref:Rrn9 domain-containing protein n=1 Tax=Epichloe festucae (strain Fl1) TaxID=877507 RepID=A0A7S9KP35_EPIFF|nr:hypothetical protein C2857_003339 [Epichloe festucae Fl1]